MDVINEPQPPRLPELPEAAPFALFESRAGQGGEIRAISRTFEPGCAQFTARQLEEYAREAVYFERMRCANICRGVNNYDNPMTAQDCAR